MTSYWLIPVLSAKHKPYQKIVVVLTHWGRVTHICVADLATIGSDNGLSPVRRQAIIWTNAGILLIGPLGTNFSETLIIIQTFSLKKTYLKMWSAKWRPFCLGLNVLTENDSCNTDIMKLPVLWSKSVKKKRYHCTFAMVAHICGIWTWFKKSYFYFCKAELPMTGEFI